MGEILDLGLGGGDGGQQKPPEGLKICPFLSPAWCEQAGSLIQGAGQQLQVRIGASPCVGVACAVWSETRERCSLRSEMAVLKKLKKEDEPSNA